MKQWQDESLVLGAFSRARVLSSGTADPETTFPIHGLARSHTSPFFTYHPPFHSPVLHLCFTSCSPFVYLWFILLLQTSIH